jgi:hypothetical protein
VPVDADLNFEVLVRIDVNRGVFQDETDIIAAVFAARKDLPEHTCHFVLVRVIGVVQNAVDTRALTFLACPEYIASDGIGHNRHSFSSRYFIRGDGKKM